MFFFNLRIRIGAFALKYLGRTVQTYIGIIIGVIIGVILTFGIVLVILWIGLYGTAAVFGL